MCKNSFFRLTENRNCVSHLWTIKAFLPEMIKAESGHIICISSAAGVAGNPGMPAYCASKFGCFGLTESIRLYLKKEKIPGVDTLIVCPAFFNSKLFEGVDPGLTKLMTVDHIADTVYQGMKNRTLQIIEPGWIHYVNYGTRLLLPTWMIDKIVRFLQVDESLDPIFEREKKKLEETTE